MLVKSNICLTPAWSRDLGLHSLNSAFTLIKLTPVWSKEEAVRCLLI